MAVIKVTKSNYKNEVTKTDRTVLLDFYATWCAPCRLMAPVIDEIAQEFPDVKVCKVNVDAEPGISDIYGITNIPTVVIIKNHEIAKTLVGVRSKTDLEDALS